MPYLSCNMMLREIFGSKTVDVTEMSCFIICTSPLNVITTTQTIKIRWERNTARMERKWIYVFNRNPDWSRRRWDNNMKIDLNDVEQEGLDWIRLVQDRAQWRILATRRWTIWCWHPEWLRTAMLSRKTYFRGLSEYLRLSSPFTQCVSFKDILRQLSSGSVFIRVRSPVCVSGIEF
jgi:hypothetical protein